MLHVYTSASIGAPGLLGHLLRAWRAHRVGVAPVGHDGDMDEPAEAGVLGGIDAEELAELDRLAADNRRKLLAGLDEYERRRSAALEAPDDPGSRLDVHRMLVWARAVNELLEPAQFRVG